MVTPLTPQVTHGFPPPVKGGTVTVCRHVEPLVMRMRTQSGYDVKLDPTPLTALDELAAALAGTTTYSLRIVRGELYYRTPAHITSEPAGTNPLVHVHAAHVCGPAPGLVPLAEQAPPRGGGVGTPTPQGVRS